MLHYHNHITVLALVMLGLYEYCLKTVYSKFIITYNLTLLRITPLSISHLRVVPMVRCTLAIIFIFIIQSCQHDLSVITTHGTLSAKLLSMMVTNHSGSNLNSKIVTLNHRARSMLNPYVNLCTSVEK